MTTPSESRVRLTTAVIVLSTFVLGAAMGAGLDHWIFASHRPPMGHPHGPPPMGVPMHELNLDAEQERKAHEIFDRHHAELEAVVRETFPRVRAVHAQIKRELRAILRPDQQRTLDAFEEHHPPPPDPFMPGPPPPGLDDEPPP